MSVNQTVENVYLRQGAMQLTRRRFWPLLAMGALMYLLPILLDTLLTLIGDQLMLPEIEAMVTAVQHYTSSENITASTPALDAAIELFTSPKFLLFNLAYMVVYGLLTTGMNLGYVHQLIQTGRGHMPRVLGVFGRMRYCLKAWALQWWIGLKLALWILPGTATFLFGATLQGHSASNWLMALGLGLIVGLVIPALFRYALATHVLADNPNCGIRACVTHSKSMMRGRLWQFFKLDFPVIFKLMGVFFAFCIIGGIVLAAFSLEENTMAIEILSWLAIVSTVYFALQLSLLPALFYLNRCASETAPVADSLLQEELSADIAPIQAVLPADPAQEQPEDTLPDTNEEKEIHHEQTDC